MLEPIINEINNSDALIIEWDNHNIPFENNSKYEVFFNGIKTSKDYENRLNYLLAEVENNLIEEIDEKPKIEQLKLLKTLKNKTDHYLGQFHDSYNNTKTTSFLKVRYCRNGIDPIESYSGIAAVEIISEFISLQILTLKNLNLFIESQIEIVKKIPKEPASIYYTRHQILILDLLRKGNYFDYRKIHPDHAGRARLLSVLLNRGEENISKHLEWISSTKHEGAYYNLKNLETIKHLFEKVQLMPVVTIIQKEIEEIEKNHKNQG